MPSQDMRAPSGESDDGRQSPETDGERVRDRAESALWDVRQTHFDAFEVGA